MTYSQLTNDAVAFAQNTAPGIATNSAAASYRSLTNSPNYRNKSVPLTQMHDQRTAFSLRLPISFGIQEITPSISYSEESDYISWGGALNYSLALNEKNTTINLGWAHNADRVRDECSFGRTKRPTIVHWLGAIARAEGVSDVQFHRQRGTWLSR